MKKIVLHPVVRALPNTIRCAFVAFLLSSALLVPASAQRMPQDSWYLAKEFSIGGEPNLIHPHSVALGPDGNIYVTDSHNHQVKVLDPQGNEIRSWGSHGSAPGQFNHPGPGIHVSGDGTVYVIDYFNHRIQIFDDRGNFLKTVGQHGEGNGQLIYPHDVTVDVDGNVYVADYHNHRVMVFSPDGSYLRKWGVFGNSDGQFHHPVGIRATPSGNIAVLERSGKRRVQVFDREGNFISTPVAGDNYEWEKGYLGELHGLTIDEEGNFYITDTAWGLHRAKVFSSSGQFLRQFGTYGSGEGQLNHPFGLAASGDRVYVIEVHGHRVAVFDKQGNWIANWGSRGGRWEPYQCGVAIDANGNIFVSDFRKNVIKKFDRENVLLKTFGSLGTGPGQFQGVLGLAIGPDDRLYALDQGGNRINVFDLEGNPAGTIGEGGAGPTQLSKPSGLAVDSEGKIYVADREKHKIFVFNSDGGLSFSFGQRGSFDGEFQSPRGVAIFPDGEIAVADHGNKRIQIFDKDGKFLRKKTFHEIAADSRSTLGGVWNDGDRNQVQHLHASPDGLLFAVADTAAQAWDGTKNIRNHGAVILATTQQLEPVKGWFPKKFVGGEDHHHIYMYSHDALGPLATTPEGDLISANGDRAGRLWKRTFRTTVPADANALPLPSILAQSRRPGTSLIDVDYEVRDADDESVHTTILAFKDGGASLSDIIPMTTFAEGTAGNIGPNTATGRSHRITWDVAQDWPTDFGELQFEVLARDSRELLNLSFIQIPAGGQDPDLKISVSPLTDRDLLPVWYWLVATADPEVEFREGSIYKPESTGQMAPGLLATHYSTPEFSGNSFSRVEDRPFLGGAGSSETRDGVPFPIRSVRWQGQFLPAKSGSYQFRYWVDDAVSIWVGDAKVVNVNNPWHYFVVPELTAGQSIPIVIEFDDRGGGSRYFHLQVAPPGEDWRDFTQVDFLNDSGILATGTTTTPLGRKFVFDKLRLREATPTEVLRAREAGNPGAPVNQWDPKLRVGPDERPAKINAYGFDTGGSGFWVVPVNQNN